MRIELCVGEGWNPFIAADGEDPLVLLDGAAEVDLAASAANLATAYAGVVQATFPDDEVVIVAADADGSLCAVEFAAADYDRLHDLTDVPANELENPESDGPMLVAEIVHGLLFDALQTDGWVAPRS